MSLTAAASGFVVVLLSVQVIQGQDDWGVTYSSTQICALKGSRVEISCTYRYPSRINGGDTQVQETFWFTELGGKQPVDLRTDSDYQDRVEYSCSEKSCTLRITDLRESDSAEYKFRFITNQPGGRYTGSPGVTLKVTDLQVQVNTFLIPSWKYLKCHSSCRLSARASYIWYKNGQKIESQTSSTYSDYFNSADSFSCAVKGHEDFLSPPVCVDSQSCDKVIYTDRSICAFKGSSVDISCTYSSYDTISSQFWFSPERSHQWQSPSQPEDLSEDSQFAGRVQVLESERGRSTLRITDLTESDSAQYHFKFNTTNFEWRSILPGTTLTVTALQVQVTRITVHQSDTEAELKCHSSCSPAGRLSYVWFKNRREVTGEETSSFKGRVYPGDIISCALKGHENYSSPSVYAPRLPSVSVSPSAEIVEGSSVTLTCSSDANPAAKYIWYKKNQTLFQGPEGVYHFSSISSEDRGNYYCKSENQYGEINSSTLFIDIQSASAKSITARSGEAVLLSLDPQETNFEAGQDFRWTHPHMVVSSKNNYTCHHKRCELLRNGSLRFSRVQPADSGRYSLQVFNKTGYLQSTKVFLLRVEDGSSSSSSVVVVSVLICCFLLLLFPIIFFILMRRRRSSQMTNTGPLEENVYVVDAR